MNHLQYQKIVRVNRASVFDIYFLYSNINFNSLIHLQNKSKKRISIKYCIAECVTNIFHLY